MNQVSTVGLDLAKHIFQLHGADSAGAVVFRKKLRRGQLLAFLATLPPCTVAMEACASAHYWGREIAKLGHTGPSHRAGVREAVRQAAEERHGRCRSDLRGRSAPDHALCGPQEREPAGRRRRVSHAGPVGSPTHPGHQRAPRSPDRVRRDCCQRTGSYLQAHRCPGGPRLRSAQAARAILAVLVEELRSLDERVAVLDREIARHAKENAVARRLMTIPGIGAVTAAALTALAPPAETFRRGRDFAAWLGLTPV